MTPSENQLAKRLEAHLPAAVAAIAAPLLAKAIADFKTVLDEEGRDMAKAVARFRAETAARTATRLAKAVDPKGRRAATVAGPQGQPAPALAPEMPELHHLADHGRQAALVEAADLEEMARLGGGDVVAMKERAAALRNRARMLDALDSSKGIRK